MDGGKDKGKATTDEAKQDLDLVWPASVPIILNLHFKMAEHRIHLNKGSKWTENQDDFQDFWVKQKLFFVVNCKLHFVHFGQSFGKEYKPGENGREGPGHPFSKKEAKSLKEGRIDKNQVCCKLIG